MVMMVPPPMPMAPATPMNFDYIGCFGTADRSALTWKRTRSLRSSKQQRGSDADTSESFIHHQSFLFSSLLTNTYRSSAFEVAVVWSDSRSVVRARKV